MQVGNRAPGAAAREVIVSTRARLHLGFLDMNFGLGRRFGSLGLAVERPVTRIRLRRASTPAASGVDSERARDFLRRIAPRESENLAITVEEAVPPHSGLGSGTQLALAVGAAAAALRGERPDARAISEMLDRGARSGIGIGLFNQGGFVVDGGRLPGGPPAPVVARLPFPEDWRVLLILDSTDLGVHGEEERDAFARMAPAPEAQVGEFCRRTLMQVLPALAEKDLESFSEGIRVIQDGMGAYFAPYQGGAAFRSPRVSEALAWLNRQGIKGTGQSSWGPTGFAFVTRIDGESLLHEARETFAGISGLSFDLVKGWNSGASVTVE